MLTYENHFGAVLLRDTETGEDVLLQSGDDVATFWEEMGAIEKLPLNQQDGRLQEFLADFMPECRR